MATLIDPIRRGRSLFERLQRVPRQAPLMVRALRLVASLLLRLWLRFYHRLHIEGRENLPQERSFILVANHCSHLDALCLLAALPLTKLHLAYPAAAADYFFSSLPRTLFSAVFLNGLPFARHQDSSRSLARCRALLAVPGHVLILFPEGTRSPTGEMGRFRSGVGRLAAGSDLPVVPCHLHGAAAAWGKGCWLPRPRRLTLTLGAPRTYVDVEPGREGAQQVAGDLQAAVARLGVASQLKMGCGVGYSSSPNNVEETPWTEGLPG